MKYQRVINDAESLERQRKLLAYCDMKTDGHLLQAEMQRAASHENIASDYDTLAAIHQQIARRVRGVLLRCTGVPTDDMSEANDLTRRIERERGGQS